jgi:hypothetical protein
MKIDLQLTELQEKALNVLLDFENGIEEIMFGGSAGVGKSRLLAIFSLLYCLKYPGVKGLWGRQTLNSITESTLVTFQEIVKNLNLEHLINYNFKSNKIIFKNGSVINMKQLARKPSDPEWGELKSTEYTFACIDECGEVEKDAYEYVKSRIRWKLKEYNLIPKLLLVSNPAKNWLYELFYSPHKANLLENYKSVILGTPEDNPFLPLSYLNSLKRLTGAKYQQQYLGNWDYSNSSLDLFSYEDYLNSFSNELQNKDNEYYLSVDVASTGDDNSVIVIWRGSEILDIKTFDTNDTITLSDNIIKIKKQYNIKASKIVVDASGVGVGVCDYLENQLRSSITRFVSASTPLNNEKFNNLKSQCMFKLSELFRMNLLKLSFDDKQIKEKLFKELVSFKNHNPFSDSKSQITPKKDVKGSLGYSPDVAEAVMMKMIFEFKKTQKLTYWV